LKKILKRQLAVVNINKIKKNETIAKLVEFARESFKIHWKGKNLGAIKSLDRITKELLIPSRSKCNIANDLMVYILLLFDIFAIIFYIQSY